MIDDENYDLAFLCVLGHIRINRVIVDRLLPPLTDVTRLTLLPSRHSVRLITELDTSS